MSALDPLRWSRRLDAIFPWVLVRVSPAYRDVFLPSKTSVAAIGFALLLLWSLLKPHRGYSFHPLGCEHVGFVLLRVSKNRTERELAAEIKDCWFCFVGKIGVTS